jgi:hypothetical protein
MILPKPDLFPIISVHFLPLQKTIDCIQIIKNYRLYTNNKLVIHNRRTLENDWSIRIHLITQMVQCGLYVVRHAQSLVMDMQFDLFG